MLDLARTEAFTRQVSIWRKIDLNIELLIRVDVLQATISTLQLCILLSRV